jgi:excisionase family DNA binding protein
MGGSRRPSTKGTPSHTDEARSLLTTEDISRWLGISGRTICYWAAAGRLPAVKIGRQWHFHRTAIEEWIRQREPGHDPRADKTGPSKRKKADRF